MTNDPRVFYMGEGSDGGVVHMLANVNGSWITQPILADAGGTPAFFFSSLAAMGTGSNRDPKVYYLTGEGHVSELAWVGGTQWAPQDLTAAADAPAADTGSGLAAMGTGSNIDPKVYYLSSDGHVHQLVWTGGQQWVNRDLTQLAGGAPAALGSPIAAIGMGDNLDPHVFVIDTNGLVQHLFWEGGDQWSPQELGGAAPPILGNGLTAIGTGRNHDPKVFYMGSGGEVITLAWDGTQWQTFDVTSLAGAPAADTSSAIAAMGTGINYDPKIYYLKPDGHVQELIWVSGFNWVTQDVSERINAAPAVAIRCLAAMGTGDNRDPRVYYLTESTDGGHVEELAWLGTNWGDLDISGMAFAPRPITGSGPQLAAMGVNPG